MPSSVQRGRLLVEWWLALGALEEAKLSLASLTDRDKYWLQRLADGATAKELERGSVTAVASRLMVVRRILGARTNEQAVAEAMRRGVVR